MYRLLFVCVLGASLLSSCAHSRVFDRDHDGVKNAVDKCVVYEEDRDGFNDKDGCPELDNDADGREDDRDKCPNDPEDDDGYLDSDGCPDPDNDKDGILDADDRCPDDAPGKDGTKGCPKKILDAEVARAEAAKKATPSYHVDPPLDPCGRKEYRTWGSTGDEDRDSVLNYKDECPRCLEDHDGVLDDDGCPGDDEDGDGVPDKIDKCPERPQSGKVVLPGCPGELDFGDD